MKRFNTSMWNADNEQVGGVYIHTQEPDGENVVKIKFTNGNTIEIKEETITDCVCEDEDNLTIGYKNETGEKQWLKISTKKFDMKKKLIEDKFGIKRPVIDIEDASDNDELINWVRENSTSPIGVHVVSNGEERPRKGTSYILAKEGYTPKNVEITLKTIKDYEYSTWTPAWMEGAPSIFVLKTADETMFLFNYTFHSYEVMGSLLDDGFILGCMDFKSSSSKEIKEDEENEEEITEEKTEEYTKSLCETISQLLEEEKMDEEVENDEEEDDLEEISEDEDEENDYQMDVGEAYKVIAKHMIEDQINSINFWTDENKRVHCDVQISTIYNPDSKD